MKKVIAIIPVKGNSRRIPGKNMRLLGDKPLVYYTINNALLCSAVDDVFISTDSVEIKEYAEALGAKVPFLRPPELCRPDVHSTVPILHMLQELGGTNNYSHCLKMLPTNPFRSVNSANEIVKLSIASDQNVLSVGSLGLTLAHLRRMTDNDDLIGITDKAVVNFQSGDTPNLFYLSGYAQCAPTDDLIEYETFHYGSPKGYLINKFETLDIDTPDDFALAEIALKAMKEESDEKI